MPVGHTENPKLRSAEDNSRVSKIRVSKILNSPKVDNPRLEWLDKKLQNQFQIFLVHWCTLINCYCLGSDRDVIHLWCFSWLIFGIFWWWSIFDIHIYIYIYRHDMLIDLSKVFQETLLNSADSLRGYGYKGRKRAAPFAAMALLCFLVPSMLHLGFFEPSIYYCKLLLSYLQYKSRIFEHCLNMLTNFFLLVY